MMDAMHVRGDHESPQEAIDRLRNRNIAMVEDREHELESHRPEHGDRRRAHRGNQREIRADNQDVFDGVVAKRRAAVEFEIGMVDLVAAPQHRHRMKQAMHGIVAEVEDRDACHARQPIGHRHPV